MLVNALTSDAKLERKRVFSDLTEIIDYTVPPIARNEPWMDRAPRNELPYTSNELSFL